MSFTYLEAEDELFGIANTAWLAAVGTADVDFAVPPTMVFPGMLFVPVPNLIYAECSFQVVLERQSAVGQSNGLKLYETTGLLVIQVKSPKSDVSALRTAKSLACAVKDAFCQPSPSWEIWFRNQKLTQVSGNETRNQVNVVITCVYTQVK